jgi:phage terminase small subunit
MFVQNRLSGLTQLASASAAGYSNPKIGWDLEKKPHIQAALVQAMEEVAEEIGFTRKEAHEMLMNAYTNAATAAEQIAAVKEMINLHGIAAPKQVEHKHEHTGNVSLERMETHELLKLADMEDLVLDGEFEVIDDQKRLR